MAEAFESTGNGHDFQGRDHIVFRKPNREVYATIVKPAALRPYISYFQRLYCFKMRYMGGTFRRVITVFT